MVGLLCVALVVGIGAATVAPAPPAWAAKEKSTVDPAEKNFKEGMARIKKGEYDGAIDSMLQAIYFARNNYNPWAWFWLGACYKTKFQDQKAIEAFKKHLEQITTSSPEAHIELGYLYMRNDRDQDASSEFHDALVEYQGPGPRARNALGQLAEKQGRYSDAIYQYRDALGDPPWTYTEAWLNMAECHTKSRNWVEAIGQYQAMLNSEFLKLSKEDQQRIYVSYGVCLLAKGDHQGAMRKWRECLSINPMNPTAHLNLAMLFDQESHISSAISEYKAFVRLAPDDKKTPKIKDRLELLEQKIKPAEPVYQPAKPTPYMRKEQEDAETAKRREFENLGGTPPSPESGF